MSELETLVGKIAAKAERKGVEVLRDKGGDWLEKGLRKAEAFVDEGLPNLGADPRELKKGLQRIRESSPDLVELGAERFRDVMAAVWAGDRGVAESKLKALTFQEQRALFAASTAEAYLEGKRREERIKAFWDLIQDLGEALLKAAVPILLAAL